MPSSLLSIDADNPVRNLRYYTSKPSVWSRCHQLELRRYRTWISSSRPSGFSRFHLFPLHLCAPPSPTFLWKPTLVSCSDVHFSRRLPRPRSLSARQRLHHLSNIKHHLDWRSTGNCQLAGRWLVSFPRFVRHGDVLHLRGQCEPTNFPATYLEQRQRRKCLVTNVHTQPNYRAGQQRVLYPR